MDNNLSRQIFSIIVILSSSTAGVPGKQFCVRKFCRWDPTQSQFDVDLDSWSEILLNWLLIISRDQQDQDYIKPFTVILCWTEWRYFPLWPRILFSDGEQGGGSWWWLSKILQCESETVTHYSLQRGGDRRFNLFSNYSRCFPPTMQTVLFVGNLLLNNFRWILDRLEQTDRVIVMVVRRWWQHWATMSLCHASREFQPQVNNLSL